MTRTIGLAFLALVCGAGLARAEPQSFGSPDAAVAAVIAAIEAQDRNALLAVFGPENEDVVFAGDQEKDREVWADFLVAYRHQNRIETPEPGRAILHIGREDWPFPAAIIGTGTNWQFNGAGAREEVRLRRIGLNELDVIDLLKAGVGVQTLYRQTDHDGDGVMEFAASILSSEGKRDGLYWPDDAGTPQSPIGAFLAEASADGYSIGNEVTEPEPYLGYYFRILQKQGPDAPGGMMDYRIAENMVAGFAFLAFPADYGQSGIMSFMVGENGVVYESDLGRETLAVGNAIETFDPGIGWKPVD